MATNEGTLHITLLHPRSSDTYEADVEKTATGREIIDQLKDERFLPDAGRSAFAMSLKERSLDLGLPLAEQGVTDGAHIQVVLPGVAGET